VRASDFDYQLPERLVAQAPATPRDASRLLVLRGDGSLEHRRFAELPELLLPGDLLVTNDTRVLPVRLVGEKVESGGRVELLLLEPLGEDGAPLPAGAPLGARWRAMGQASKPVRPGAALAFGPLRATVLAALGDGFFDVALDREGTALEAALAAAGQVPLPPYVRRAPTEEDRDRYQTVFARTPGSAAAPTAGLHFTEAVLDRLAAGGVERASVTLHVGPGTFLPVRGEELETHVMHEERYEVSEAAAAAVAAARNRSARVVAVGTTTVRTLESAWRGGRVVPGGGRTSLFIRPGHSFGAVDILVTNFHLPRSTLLMLVCAFGGRERVLGAYEEAVRRGYRFYSYGDAMLVETRTGSRPGVV
jgi:S-adenosylmethionine:tRNA ribosyltransferase-isomerase